MRLIGVVGAHPGSDVWVAHTDMADTPTRGPVKLIAPLRDFWTDPHGAMQSPDGHVVEVTPNGQVSVVPPVLPEARVICVGLNYYDHVAEGSFKNMELPQHPTLFGRWTQSLTVGGTSAPVPPNERGLDWEGEVAAWIGRELSAVTSDEARAAVLGYSTFNDLTARIAQKLTTQFTIGKNADRSGPIGPLVTADEVGDLRDGLKLQTRVNGTVVQDSNTSLQIHEVGATLAHISQTLTLQPGDILCTGTPSGVGYARDPEWLLNDGDIVEVTADHLGTLRTPISGPAGR